MAKSSLKIGNAKRQSALLALKPIEEVQFLLLLVTVLTQTLLALVRSHLVTLMLLSVWHSCNCLYGFYLIFDANDLAGLKAGML